MTTISSSAPMGLSTMMPLRSSFRAMFSSPDEPSKLVNLNEAAMYAVPLTFGKTGIYDSDAYAFNACYGINFEQSMLLANFQLFQTLVTQFNSGTPLLMLPVAQKIGAPMELAKALATPSVFEDSSTNGSPFFNPAVAQEIKRIRSGQQAAPPVDMARPNKKKNKKKKNKGRKVRINDPDALDVIDDEEEEDDDDDAVDTDDEGGRRPVPRNMDAHIPMDATAYPEWGVTNGGTRPKFDIAMLPVYAKPLAARQEDKGLIGVVFVALCFDPNYTIHGAWDNFVRDNETHQSSPGRKCTIHFSADPFILKHLTNTNKERTYTDHFGEYIRVNPRLAARVGNNINDRSRLPFTSIWSIENSLLHIYKTAGMDPVNSESAMFYRRLTSNFDRLELTPEFEPYLIDYSRFVWNTYNAPYRAKSVTQLESVGLFYEFFPWVEKYCAEEIAGFERFPVSDTEAKVSSLAADMFKQQNTNEDTDNVFVPSQFNAIVAVAEVVRDKLKDILDPLQSALNAPVCGGGGRTIMDILMRDHNLPIDGELVEQTNKQLHGDFNKRCKVLDTFQRKINRFMKKAILTNKTHKALTTAVQAVVDWMTARPNGSQSTMESKTPTDVPNNRTLADRLASPYLFYRTHPNLSIEAIEFITAAVAVRYALLAATCTPDILVLRDGLNDAYRYMFDMHFHWSASGPLGSSKSHAIKTDTALRVPGTVSTVTNFSAQALSAFGDQSDSIYALDEAPQGLAPKGGPGGGDYSPEAATWKAAISQAFNVRQVLDIGKSYSERRMRKVTIHLCMSIAVATNIVMGDAALRSRFFQAVMTSLTDDVSTQAAKSLNNGGRRKPTAGADASRTELASNQDDAMDIDAPEMAKRDAQIGIQDFIYTSPLTSTPFGDGIGRMAANVFTDQSQVSHALIVLANKLEQSGALPHVSDEMMTFLVMMFKFFKESRHMNSNPRTMIRAKLLARSMTIRLAVVRTFMTPGFHDDLKKRPFDVTLLHYIKPYLYISFQTMVMATAMLANEMIKPHESVVMTAISRHFIRNEAFPADALLAATALYHAKEADQGVTNAEIETSPLWTALVDNDGQAPLEFLYTNYATTHRFRTLSRQVSGTGIPNRRRGPVNMIGSASELLQATLDEDQTLVDLNYIDLNTPLTELLSALHAKISPALLLDTIQTSIQSFRARKINIVTCEPQPKSVLDLLKPGERLPRKFLSLNVFEVAGESKRCYVCVHALYDLIHRSSVGDVMKDALRSIYYKNMKPRTLLITTETTTQYDVRNSLLEISADDLARPGVPRYLRVIDPSHVQETTSGFDKNIIDSVNQSVAANIDTLERQSEIRLREIEARSKGNMFSVLSEGQQMLDEMNYAVRSRALAGHEEREDEFSTASFRMLFDKSKEVEIKLDPDEFACVLHFKNAGIPMRINPVTGETECSMPWHDAPVWEPLPTSLNSIHQHKMLDETRSTWPAARRPAAVSSNSSAQPTLFGLATGTLPPSPSKQPQQQQPPKKNKRPQTKGKEKEKEKEKEKTGGHKRAAPTSQPDTESGAHADKRARAASGNPYAADVFQ